MVGTLPSRCPDCRTTLKLRKGESADSRARRVQAHSGTPACVAAKALGKLKRRDYVRLQGKQDYRQGYHELKVAGLVEVHATAVRRGLLRSEAWAPRWAYEYVLWLRTAEGKPGYMPLHERARDLEALAAEPDSGTRALAMMVLSGVKRK